MKKMPEMLCVMPEGKKVTIFFEDGTKSTAKCSPNDTFDLDTGIAICIAKRLMSANEKEGTSAFNDYIRRAHRIIQSNFDGCNIVDPLDIVRMYEYGYTIHGIAMVTGIHILDVCNIIERYIDEFDGTWEIKEIEKEIADIREEEAKKKKKEEEEKKKAHRERKGKTWSDFGSNGFTTLGDIWREIFGPDATVPDDYYLYGFTDTDWEDFAINSEESPSRKMIKNKAYKNKPSDCKTFSTKFNKTIDSYPWLYPFSKETRITVDIKLSKNLDKKGGWK